MFGDLDWPLNASRRFASISWASCFIARQHEYSCRARCCHGKSVRVCVCLSVTRWYCVEMNANIFKPFPLSGIGVLLVFSSDTVITKLQRDSLCRGVKYTEWENLHRNRRLSPKRYKIGLYGSLLGSQGSRSIRDGFERRDGRGKFFMPDIR